MNSSKRLKLLQRVLVGLASCLVLVTPQSWAQTAPVQSCKDPGSTMLWQVQAPAGKARRDVTVALMGSVHVGKPEFYPLPAVIEREFQSANTLVFEVDPSSLESPQTALATLQRGQLAGSQTLDQVVDAATMKSLKGAMQKVGLPEQMLGMFSKMKPWMVGMTLSALQIQTLGYNQQAGVENYLLQHKPAAARIGELESMDLQLGMLDSLDQAFFLRYTLQDFDTGTTQMEAMASAWRCGDHKGLEAILFDARNQLKVSPADAASLDKLMKSMLTDRNVGMADKIDAYFRSGQGHYFVTVGALHLLGEGSVVDLLRKRGYSVNPVRK